MTDEEKKEFEEFLKWKAERNVSKGPVEDTAESPVQQTNEENNEVDLESLDEEHDNSITDNSDASKGKGGYSTILILLGMVWLLVMVLGVGNSSNSISNSSVDRSEKEDQSEYNNITSRLLEETKPEPAKVTWSISTQEDEMTDSKNIWAEIKSDNFISQDFPYEGQTYAKITVRYMKKYGYDVLIEITKGQIHGSSYSGENYITARFDEGTPKRYYFSEAADGSSELVFISNHSDFIKRCKQAKNIKIDIPIWQEGRPVFTFHVDEPLVWPKE